MIDKSQQVKKTVVCMPVALEKEPGDEQEKVFRTPKIEQRGR